MNEVKIIAEAGVNHNGSVELAHKLIDLAKESGADIVKFQTFSSELVLRHDTPLVEYQKNAGSENMFDLVKKLELTREEFAQLNRHCQAVGIEFLSTAFDLPSFDFLCDELKMQRIKIPSGEIVNVPLLRRAVEKGKPIILSTGMCIMEEIEFALHTMRTWRPQASGEITILHCTTAYPTHDSDIHLLSMVTLRDAFRLPTGLSDHSEGHLAAAGAVALGAVAIEKHFTLDRNMNGPDHRASVDPVGLRELVRTVRSIEVMMGSAEKKPRPVEREAIKLVRRSLVATRNIIIGEIIHAEDLVALRPEDGISVREIDRVVGSRAWASFQQGEVLKWPVA